MANVVVVGSQWGDEGKGKIVDWLSERADIVARFQGGHNAGHTLVIDGTVYKLSLLPSGIVREGKISVIGNGVVIDPWALLAEIETLHNQGVAISPENLKIAENAVLILPVHQDLDAARESAASEGSKIGTTKRGIGPAYEDKVARRGVRLGDLLHPERFASKLKTVMELHNFQLTQYYKTDAIDYQTVYDQAMTMAEQLKPMIADVTGMLHDSREAGKNILFEGAQGSLLDIDHGTYPFVTSSNTTAGGTATGSGFGPLYLDYVLGITKAYTTRVGSGPFPTELHCEIGQYLGEKGHEFGTTTGRSRRCGWFDAVALRQAVRINSISGICLTKLDVLDGLEEVNICVAYINADGTDAGIPMHADDFENITPVYETMPGWTDVTVGAQRIEDLPQAARNYINRIEELTGAPVDVVSTGPDRVETIVLRHAFD